MANRSRATREPAPALTRNALIPLSIVVCFVLVYVVHAPPWWVIPIGLGVMALYLGAPVLGQRSLARFDRDLVQLLARGKRSELAGRFNASIGMRLFAAPARVAERKGLVAAELGDAARARDAYRLALEGYGPGEAPLAVRLGLAHACYALGEDDDAIQHYRAVLGESAGLPKVSRNLAHALARKGDDLAEAERLSEELLRDAGDAPSPELLLVRALIHAKRGERGAAERLLERASEGGEELRAEVSSALKTPAKKKKKKKAAGSRPSSPD